MNAPLIKPNATRGAGSTAVLEYLARIWPLGACRAALTNVFVSADGRATATQPLAKRVDTSLANMVKSDMLSSRGKGADRQWLLGPAAQLNAQMGPHTQPESKAQDKDELPAYVGEHVPPRQSGQMGASVYRPKPMQALRLDSDAFARCPSLRDGQRVPFTGGYVGMSGSQS